MSPLQEILKALTSPRPVRWTAIDPGLTADPCAQRSRGRDRDDSAARAYAVLRPADFGKQIRRPARIANDNEQPAIGC